MEKPLAGGAKLLRWCGLICQRNEKDHPFQQGIDDPQGQSGEKLKKLGSHINSRNRNGPQRVGHAFFL
jgi:hypothetical protein